MKVLSSAPIRAYSNFVESSPQRKINFVNLLLSEFQVQIRSLILSLNCPPDASLIRINNIAYSLIIPVRSLTFFCLLRAFSCFPFCLIMPEHLFYTSPMFCFRAPPFQLAYKWHQPFFCIIERYVKYRVNMHSFVLFPCILVLKYWSRNGIFHSKASVQSKKMVENNEALSGGKKWPSASRAASCLVHPLWILIKFPTKLYYLIVFPWQWRWFSCVGLPRVRLWWFLIQFARETLKTETLELDATGLSRFIFFALNGFCLLAFAANAKNLFETEKKLDEFLWKCRYFCPKKLIWSSRFLSSSRSRYVKKLAQINLVWRQDLSINRAIRR